MTAQGLVIGHTPGASAAQFRVASYPILGTVALLLMEVQQIVQRGISHQPTSAKSSLTTPQGGLNGGSVQPQAMLMSDQAGMPVSVFTEEGPSLILRPASQDTEG